MLQKSNVVPEHNKPFAVDYSFTFNGMMREPLLLISGAQENKLLGVVRKHLLWATRGSKCDLTCERSVMQWATSFH